MSRRSTRKSGWLFPAQKREFPGKRWVKISLRSLHLVGVAGVGAVYLGNASDAWPYLWLALATGGLMFLIEVWSHGIWLLQLRGWTVIFKLVLLSLLGLLAGTGEEAVVIAVILLSGVIAHAPGKVRYYSPFGLSRYAARDR